MHFATCIIALAASGLLALALAPAAAWAGHRLRLLDKPGLRRVHKQAVPRVGGAAVVLAMLGGLAVATWLSPVLRHWPIPSGLGALAVLGLMVFLTGLADDILELRPLTKLLAQCLLAVTLCAMGTRLESVTFAPGVEVNLGLLSWPVSILWVLVVTNAVNLIDGLDGLAAGIAAIAAASVAAFAVHSGQFLLAVTMLALLGSLLGYLPFNFYPARIFLGDCGSMFLGFFLAGASLHSAKQSHDLVGLALPALALGVPMVDTLLSVLRRLIQRRSIFSADRQHIHHLLLEMHHSQRRTVVTILALTAALAGLGTLMLLAPSRCGLAVFLASTAVGLVVLRSLLKFHPNVLLVSVGKTWRVFSQARRQRRLFEQCLMLLKEAKTFSQWWQDTCASAEKMGFLRLSMHVQDRTGDGRKLEWERADVVPYCGLLQLSVQVRHRRPGPPLQLTAELPVGDSTETAGMQAAFFGRLLDEFSLADLPIKMPEPAQLKQSA